MSLRVSWEQRWHLLSASSVQCLVQSQCLVNSYESVGEACKAAVRFGFHQYLLPKKSEQSLYLSWAAELLPVWSLMPAVISDYSRKTGKVSSDILMSGPGHVYRWKGSNFGVALETESLKLPVKGCAIQYVPACNLAWVVHGWGMKTVWLLDPDQAFVIKSHR